MHSQQSKRPSELAVCIAMLPHRYYSDGWRSADEVRGRLALLGFDVRTQQVAAWLGRMSRVDAPWVERRESTWGDLEYRITHYGLNDLENRFGLSARHAVAV